MCVGGGVSIDSHFFVWYSGSTRGIQGSGHVGGLLFDSVPMLVLSLGTVLFEGMGTLVGRD